MTEQTTSLDDALSGDDVQPQPEQEPQEAEPVAKEPEPPADDGGQIKVPLAALHEVRDANRALKQEMEALKASQQPAKEAEPAPDMFADPEGYAAWQQGQVSAAIGQVTAQFESRLLNMSEAHAIGRHGADVVEKAKEWALSQPDTVKAEIVGQADPYEFAVQQHQRVTLSEQLADPKIAEQFQKFLNGETKQPEPPKAPPTNTAVDQSVGARNVQWAGPTSLDDIFTN